MDYFDKYDKIVEKFSSPDFKVDMEKTFIRGNKSAGVRMRKHIQDIIKSLQEIRKDSLDLEK